MHVDIKIWIQNIILLFIAGFILLFSKCPLQEMFGIPCPGCNMTTALYYLLHGNVQSALFYHPLVFVLLLCIFLEVIIYLRFRSFTNKYAKIVFWGFIVLLLVVYLYRMIFVFPNIPMVYVEDHLFAKIKALFY